MTPVTCRLRQKNLDRHFAHRKQKCRMGTEIELYSIDFITIGTVGPKGRRQFNLQAGKEDQIVTLTLEKEQARRLGEAVMEMLDELKRRHPERSEAPVNMNQLNMDLREPIEPIFRIAEMGLGYNDLEDHIIMVIHELLVASSEEDAAELDPSVVRLSGTREQFRALGLHTLSVVTQGRADPHKNGHVINYWI